MERNMEKNIDNNLDKNIEPKSKKSGGDKAKKAEAKRLKEETKKQKAEAKKQKEEAKKQKEEAEMMQILKNCQNSMLQVFAEQTTVSTLVDEDFMEAFSNSPEYREALLAFKKRFEAERK